MKKRINVAILAASLLISAGSVQPAFAQDVSKVKVKKSVDKKAQEEALERSEERSKRLDKKKGSADAAQPDGPSVTAADVEAEERSPEEIDRLKRQLESKNREIIAKLDKLIADDPGSDQMPDLMFQKAELLWELRNWEYLRERAKFNQCLDASMKGTVDEGSCQEPVADYGEAQELYKDIAGQHPGYERLDEVFYRLGKGLIEAGEGAAAVTYLQKLVANYPNSKYIPDTHLALGEYFFKKELLGAAKDNYAKVLKYKSYPLWDYSLYKLGWVYYNQQEYRKSVKTFKAVVERSEEKLGFQNQAINDLIVAYAEIDGGWIEAREYLKKKRDAEFMYKKIGQLAGLYEAQGKDDLAVDIFQWFITEKPNDPKVPQWAESIIVARKREESKFDELEKSMTRFVAYFDEGGTWYTKNKGDERAINNAMLLTDASLAFLSNFYHRRAQKQDNKDDYRKAAHYYEEYIKRFPNTVAAFDMNFFLGEILLLDLNEYEKAATQYQKVVDLYKAGKVPKEAKKEDVDAIVKDSAYAVVNAYNELVKKHHQDSILVEMAKYDESQRAKQATNQQPESIETKPIPRTELLKYEEGFVKASDQYSEMYPKEQVTPTVDFVAAEVYKSHGQYDKAVPRYESIIENAPKHRYASFAGNSLLESNYRLQRWSEVEKWGRHLLENKIFDVTPKPKLEAAIVYAINESAIDLKEEKNTDAAVERWISLADEFPESDYAPGAVFNAAAAREAADEINKAVDLYERVVTKYPKSQYAPEAIFVMGAVFESRADFDRAATYFERLGSEEKYTNAKGEEVEYKDHEKAADAVYNAAVIREAMQEYDKAIKTYESYMELYPERENVRDLNLHLAYLAKDKKDHKDAMKRFDAFLARKDVKPAEQVEINLEKALLVTQMKEKNWEKNSDVLFTKVVDQWNKLGEEDKKKTKYYPAQARFLQAERVFEKFKGVKLEFPINTLKKRLLQKGELEQEAEKMYTEVISMESPRWVAASAYRVGQMYKEFSDQLYDLPMPEGLTEDQEFEYRGYMDEQAFPLQEKALKAFQTALALALQYQAYNEWSAKSATAISKLESEAYPITGQDGVNVEHERTNFSQPDPVLSLDVVRERVKARKKNEKPAAPSKEAAQPNGGQAAR